MLAPGCARLATTPLATGSPSVWKTMGISLVVFFAAKTAGVDVAAITSTLSQRVQRPDRAADRFCPLHSGTRSLCFCPSTYPNARKPCRNASSCVDIKLALDWLRTPIRASFFVCCASANRPRAKAVVTRNRQKIFFIVSITVPNICFSTPSSDDFVRPHQHVRRNYKTNLLRGFEVDDEFKLRRLLNR